MILLFSVCILVVIFAVQIAFYKKGSIKNIARFFLWLTVTFIIGYFVYLTIAQYYLWNSGELSQYFVPPYQDTWYVVNYHFIRFGLYYLISLAAAAVFFITAQKLNKHFNERFFEQEELYLGALSIFLLGNPAWGYAWIFYIVAMLSVAAIATSYQLLVAKENHRFSLYWLWLPVAILIIIVMNLF